MPIYKDIAFQIEEMCLFFFKISIDTSINYDLKWCSTIDMKNKINVLQFYAS